MDDSYISIATISGGSLNLMTSVQTAPRMSAGVFSRSLNFFNGAGQYEGLNAMSQPDTNVQLFSGDTGFVGRTYAVRSYGVSVRWQHGQGRLESTQAAGCIMTELTKAVADSKFLLSLNLCRPPYTKAASI